VTTFSEYFNRSNEWKEMEANVVSALSAVFGSIVGGSASIASSWFTLHIQSQRERVRSEIQKREALYAEFISEGSKLAIDSLDHTLDDPERFAQMYALQNRIRLTSSRDVVDAGDEFIHTILQRYYSPKMTPEEKQAYALSLHDDALKPFAEACRGELARLHF
jgi:hypothetical protein